MHASFTSYVTLAAFVASVLAAPVSFPVVEERRLGPFVESIPTFDEGFGTAPSKRQYTFQDTHKLAPCRRDLGLPDEEQFLDPIHAFPCKRQDDPNEYEASFGHLAPCRRELGSFDDPNEYNVPLGHLAPCRRERGSFDEQKRTLGPFLESTFGPFVKTIPTFDEDKRNLGPVIEPFVETIPTFDEKKRNLRPLVETIPTLDRRRDDFPEIQLPQGAIC